MNKNLIYLALFLFLAGGITFLSAAAYPFGGGFAFIMSLLTLLWVVSLFIKDSSIVDIFWGPGFVAIAWWYYYITGETDSIRNLVLCGMVSLWGLRLGIYLGKRNIGKAEDYRYQEFRRQGGKNYWWISFLRVYLLQGIILWIVSSVFLVAMESGKSDLQTLDYVGIGLWAVGLFFEAVGDWQLTRFKKNPDNKGKVMDTGLWRYTRHPNYFGDALLWWGFFLFALANTTDGWLYIFSPVFMTFLLLKVSGVAMLERKLTKKPQYADYIRKTSAFIPMLPKE